MYIISFFYYIMLKGSYSYLSREFILSKVTEEQIFEKYLNINVTSLIDNGMFCNPLRSDTNPTCTFKVINSRLKFRDWADTGAMDCFDLVQHICNDCSFLDALRIISHHFSLLGAETDNELRYILPPDKLREVKQKQSNKIDLKIKRIDWTKAHLKFYQQFGLELQDLEEDTFPIKCYWVNGIKYELKTLMFAYHFKDKSSETYPYDYKIYCPYADRKSNEFKFIHNNADIIQGESGLKFDKRTLLITSSFKDVKVLRKVQRLYCDKYDFNFEVAAPMSETTPIKKEKINFLKSVYENILLYHNNDAAGLRAAETQSQLYGCGYIMNPPEYDKDPSDIVKTFNYDELAKVLDELLNPKIPF